MQLGQLNPHGHGQDRIKEALLRRGWHEVLAGAEPKHAHRRLIASADGAIGFVWLRGDPQCKILHSLPRAVTSAVINRWPSRPSASGSPLGLRRLWHKAELVTTLEDYYRAQRLDPWRHHPLSFKLPQGATVGSAEWDRFARAFDAVGRGEDTRVPSKQCTHNLWLLKPTGGWSGKGIGIASSVAELLAHYERCVAGGSASIGSPIASSAWVVQKYLEAPLLYKKRKFDVRIFALLESAPSPSPSPSRLESAPSPSPSPSRLESAPRAAHESSPSPSPSPSPSSVPHEPTELGLSLYAYREGYGRTSSEEFYRHPHPQPDPHPHPHPGTGAPRARSSR